MSQIGIGVSGEVYRRPVHAQRRATLRYTFSLAEVTMCAKSDGWERGASILCILPPHMLDAIARNGTAAQRAAALATLATDEAIRDLRAEEQPTARAARLIAPKPPAVPKKRRTIYDAAGAQRLPGKVVRKEGARSSGDVAVDEAYAGLGATFDFYLATFRRRL